MMEFMSESPSLQQQRRQQQQLRRLLTIRARLREDLDACRLIASGDERAIDRIAASAHDAISALGRCSTTPAAHDFERHLLTTIDRLARELDDLMTTTVATRRSR
jgi:hypothetical protein